MDLIKVYFPDKEIDYVLIEFLRKTVELSSLKLFVNRSS